MQENNQRFADDLARLDRDLGRAMRQRDDAPTQAEQDAFLGEDSALLRGLLAGMTLAGVTDPR